MTLLYRCCPVCFQDRLDHRYQQPQLRLRRRALPPSERPMIETPDQSNYTRFRPDPFAALSAVSVMELRALMQVWYSRRHVALIRRP
jgi:hypothetical protein